jgi:hypothetical protein
VGTARCRGDSGRARPGRRGGDGGHTGAKEMAGGCGEVGAKDMTSHGGTEPERVHGEKKEGSLLIEAF